jgi:hypothetical protein
LAFSFAILGSNSKVATFRSAKMPLRACLTTFKGVTH